MKGPWGEGSWGEGSWRLAVIKVKGPDACKLTFTRIQMSRCSGIQLSRFIYGLCPFAYDTCVSLCAFVCVPARMREYESICMFNTKLAAGTLSQT